jgi:hypothetical protein
VKVRELLTDESKWTQWAFARDEKKLPIYSSQLFTMPCTSYCLWGAIKVCYGTQPGGLDSDLSLRVRKRVQGKVEMPIEDWNDDENRTFEQVKALVEELDI